MAAPRKIAPILFLPGLVFWVLIGVGFATDNMNLVGAAFVLLVVALTFGAVRAIKRSAAQRRENARIWAAGTPAKATIANISTRGGGLNDNPLVEFELDVRPDGAEPYRADVSVIVNKLFLPRIQPGSEIDVRVDPADPTRVLIDESLTYLGYKA